VELTLSQPQYEVNTSNSAALEDGFDLSEPLAWITGNLCLIDLNNVEDETHKSEDCRD